MWRSYISVLAIFRFYTLKYFILKKFTLSSKFYVKTYCGAFLQFSKSDFLNLIFLKIV